MELSQNIFQSKTLHFFFPESSDKFLCNLQHLLASQAFDYRLNCSCKLLALLQATQLVISNLTNFVKFLCSQYCCTVYIQRDIITVKKFGKKCTCIIVVQWPSLLLSLSKMHVKMNASIEFSELKLNLFNYSFSALNIRQGAVNTRKL